MAHAGRIVALGLTLAVGVLGGVAIERSTATPAAAPASVAQADQPAPVAVTVTQTVQADPVTVTATVAPQPTSDPTGPKDNGSYLVGAELTAGTWKCSRAGDIIYWAERNHGGDLIDNGLSTLATIDGGTYIADLTGCAGTWSLVG